MTGTRRTTILATVSIDVPLIVRQVFASEIIHGGVVRNKILTHCNWERGLTAAL